MFSGLFVEWNASSETPKSRRSARCDSQTSATIASGVRPCFAAYSSIGVPCVSSAQTKTTSCPAERW